MICDDLKKDDDRKSGESDGRKMNFGPLRCEIMRLHDHD